MSFRGRRHDSGGQNELIFFYTGNGSATFDPTITTSQATTIVWQPDDAVPTVTTGTSHAFSYVPGSGSHRCKATVVGGLRSVIGIACDSDAILSIANLRRCQLSTINGFTNPAWVLRCSEIPSTVETLSLSGNTQFTGDLSELACPVGTQLNLSSTPVTGDLASLSAKTIIDIRLADCAGVYGNISSINPACQKAYIYISPNVTLDSIAPLVNIKDIRIYNNSKNQTVVDAVIDSIYQAVVANANHFVAATPITLQIGGSGGTANAAPGGTYQYAASPSTGLEKVYYLTHLATHAWAITWNGGAGP